MRRGCFDTADRVPQTYPRDQILCCCNTCQVELFFESGRDTSVHVWWAEPKRQTHVFFSERGVEN